jgi:class 3 adenylate cyclase
MRVLLFGKNRRRRPAKGKTAQGFVVETYPLEDLPAMIPSLQHGTLVYLDLAGLASTQRQKMLSVIPENPDLLFGVLDPAGVIIDIGALFHAGVVDYLGRRMRGSRLDVKRISRVLSFADSSGVEEQEEDELAAQAAPALAEVSADGWARIVPGREYEFAILFIEVDGSEELKKRHEPDNLTGAMETFKSFVERIVSPHGGRTWMWSQFGGLVLFPLKNGAGAAPVCGLRLLLSRIFYDVEESLLPGHISFHMALSIGSTVYRVRDTGEIISESLNSVFHLGKKFTRPSQFFISAEAMGLVPEKLKALCFPVGSYEGKRIFRLIPPRPTVMRKHGDGQPDD